MSPTEIRELGFNPFDGDSTERFEQAVLSHLPDHPAPLKALLVRVTNKGERPIRDLTVTAAHHHPTTASMNNDDPDNGVRRVPEGLVPLRPGSHALFAFPQKEAHFSVSELAVCFTDDEDRRWKKDVHSVITAVAE